MKVECVAEDMDESKDPGNVLKVSEEKESNLIAGVSLSQELESASLA